jgi:uncharacterized protein (UPF0147 family)
MNVTSKYNIMKRLFNLFLVFLRTKDEKDKRTLGYEVELLRQKIVMDDTIPSNVKKNFFEILRQYTIMYESDSLIEKFEAEERVKDLLEDMKKIQKF